MFSEIVHACDAAEEAEDFVTGPEANSRTRRAPDVSVQAELMAAHRHAMCFRSGIKPRDYGSSMRKFYRGVVNHTLNVH